MNDDVMKDVAHEVTQRAKAKKPEMRGLMDTLLAADIPLERAVALITDESMKNTRAVSGEHAWLIRNHRMPQFPEGSAVYRRLGMIADMLDPSIENAYWDFSTDTD